MKAVRKNGEQYDVRFVKPLLYRLYEIVTNNKYEYGGVCDVEININGNWYRSELGHINKPSDPKVMIPVIILHKAAVEALGAKFDWNKRTMMRLDEDYLEEFKAYLHEQFRQAEEKADGYTFTKLWISDSYGRCSIAAWDAYVEQEFVKGTDVNYWLYLFNHEAREIVDLFTAADKADCRVLSEYFRHKDSYDYERYWYIVTREDLPMLRKLAKPELLRRKKIAEREENIANGAIYFECESRPHNEDLTNVMLTRPCPKEGTFTLLRRISDADFARIKKYGRYYDEEFLEDCDMFYSAPGWRFGCQAVEELAKDHRVFVDDKEVVLDKVNNDNI